MGVFDGIIKPALDSVTTLIGQFHLSPEDKLKADQAIRDAQDKAREAAQEYDAKLNDIAGQNIRAEASSNDKFTVRSRPAVIWMGNALIFWNYALVPVAGAHWHLSPVVLPDAFWWTWGTVVTGYVFTRSAEKIAQMPGDSQVNIAGLLKIGNKQ